MERTPVNPWGWSLEFGFNQGEVIQGHRRDLICSGQTAMDADGKPQHAGDMRSQLSMALHNLEAVLAGAGMTLANVVRLNIYTTDVDELLTHGAVLVTRLGAAGIAPLSTRLCVTRLAFPSS